jgi:16S rRNA (cytosine1402-N4)-methyltransferase
VKGQFDHVPVMGREVVELFLPVPAGLIVDATVGGGGHAALLLEARSDLRLLGVDRDADAVAAARERLSGFGDRAEVVQGRFGELREILSEQLGKQLGKHGEGNVIGVLFDLGVSSAQLDRPERGFSYRFDAPLDMRMDASSPLTAAEIVNTWDEREIAEILSSYGEERYARQIARAIVRRRAARPVERSADLVELIRSAIPTPARFGQGHPARRVFQALRIATNDELQSLRDGLDAALEVLTPGGRIVVISFHSLEDRIVKRFIRDAARGCTCPPDFPVCVCGHQPALRSLTSRAVVPSVEERCENPRSASAKLRAAERTQAA